MRYAALTRRSLWLHSQDGDTPMHLAARDGKQEAVQLLVKHGADTSIKNKVRRAASLLGPR